jgi:hypothetical protein
MRRAMDKPRAATAVETPPSSVPTLGELRASWRERHLCLGCVHHAVCKMANALDPNFLVVISQCLAFEAAEAAAPVRG